MSSSPTLDIKASWLIMGQSHALSLSPTHLRGWCCGETRRRKMYWIFSPSWVIYKGRKAEMKMVSTKIQKVGEYNAAMYKKSLFLHKKNQIRVLFLSCMQIRNWELGTNNQFWCHLKLLHSEAASSWCLTNVVEAVWQVCK